MTHAFPVASGTRPDAFHFPVRHQGRDIGRATLAIRYYCRGEKEYDPSGSNTAIEIDTEFNDPEDAHRVVEPIVQGNRVRGVRVAEHEPKNQVNADRFDAGTKGEKPVELREILNALEKSAGLRAGVRKYLAKHRDDDDDDDDSDLPLAEQRVDAASSDPAERARAAMVARSRNAWREKLGPHAPAPAAPPVTRADANQDPEVAREAMIARSRSAYKTPLRAG